ncbi:MAG: hypothetical protein IPG10_19010 [Flavobacteriales bacterium]|nr:hypothetical protein [Flavobacteriales bacterium]
MYVFVLLVFIAAADAMHPTALPTPSARLFAYLLTFFTAPAIFLAGFYGCRTVKEAIGTMMDSGPSGGGAWIGVFGLIVLFTSITALNMAGVDTTLVTSSWWCSVDPHRLQYRIRLRSA